MVSLDSTPHIVPNRLVIPLPLSSRRKANSLAILNAKSKSLEVGNCVGGVIWLTLDGKGTKDSII